MKKRLWSAALAVAVCLGAGKSSRRTVPLEVPVPPAPPAEVPFTDVAFGQRWYDGAQYGYRKGLVLGMTERSFGGELPATRAMAATMVWRMAGRPEVLGKSRFQDVKQGKYYTPAVVWGETRGLWEGYGDGTFRPEDGVTWGQLELVLERYMGLEKAAASLLAAPLETEDRPMNRGELAEALMEACEEGGRGKNG